MRTPCLTLGRSNASQWRMMWRCLPMLGLVAMTGCVTVKAPDRPIEINLNINVKQEVVVSLKKEAEDFVANNPELFPK